MKKGKFVALRVKILLSSSSFKPNLYLINSFEFELEYVVAMNHERESILLSLMILSYSYRIASYCDCMPKHNIIYDNL